MPTRVTFEEKDEKLIPKVEGHAVSYSLSFSLSLSFYISSERASKGLQDGIRMKSVR